MQSENLIKLLSEALKFYSEEANYDNNQIKNDRGFQGRHILKIISDNEALMKSYENEFNEFEKAKNEASEEDINKLINDLKNLR